jgi:hypothetical protein
MQREYRIQPIQVPVHGLRQKALDILDAPMGFELFRREGIRLVSMGIFNTEEAAKDRAKSHAGSDTVIFV